MSMGEFPAHTGVGKKLVIHAFKSLEIPPSLN